MILSMTGVYDTTYSIWLWNWTTNLNTAIYFVSVCVYTHTPTFILTHRHVVLMLGIFLHFRQDLRSQRTWLGNALQGVPCVPCAGPVGAAATPNFSSAAEVPNSSPHASMPSSLLTGLISLDSFFKLVSFFDRCGESCPQFQHFYVDQAGLQHRSKSLLPLGCWD